MYALGRKVLIQAPDFPGVIGTVIDRHYIGKPRRAAYLVEYAPGKDILLGREHLSGHDE